MPIHTPTAPQIDATKIEVKWIPTSTQSKTGNIPQGYIGTYQEARYSCIGCPLDKECYHWAGRTGNFAHKSITKASAKHPGRYTLQNAINNAARSAEYARLAVGGDPWVHTRKYVADMHRQWLAADFKGMLGYTHFPKTKGKHLKGLVLASCNLKQADELIDIGWRVAIDLPFKAPGVKRHKHVPVWDGQPITTPAGRPINICDAQISKTDCNHCGKCNPLDLRLILAIGWLLH